MNVPKRVDPPSDGITQGQGMHWYATKGIGRRPQTRTPSEVQQWFVDYLAKTLHVHLENIDVKAPFEMLGLDSVTAVGMTGDLEDWLGFCTDPMTVYDYPTIEALAGHLAQRSQSPGAADQISHTPSQHGPHFSPERVQSSGFRIFAQPRVLNPEAFGYGLGSKISA